MEGLIPGDASVRLMSHELEELDYTLLYQAYSAKGRNSIVAPKTMFKILTYACEDLFSQMVRWLADAGELSKETVFIGATKLEAYANK